ncbi:Hsp20/alpha crystallin family protein [Candidatus Alkanophaga liquidiphilum]|nr:Small heat shock protein IbpA [Candidatus Alkanophaga liquidiphilum]RLG37951.1 MAG: hypothetical protein DRN91_04060 [Candidatus Alkanophagales archaeon]
MLKKDIWAMWRHDGCLEPLYEMENRENEIVVTIDLPYVRKDDIKVYVTENMLEVSAEMRSAVSWERWGSIQRRITFSRFKKQIHLPEKVNPDEVSATFKNGVLRITLPKVRRHVPIKVE